MSTENPSQGSIDAFRESIFESFSEVRDPRILGNAIRHELAHILFMTLSAVLCGANKLKEIAVYAKEREEWFKTVNNHGKRPIWRSPKMDYLAVIENGPPGGHSK